MHVENVSIKDITTEQILQWNRWAAPNGTLLSPYFLFEFAEIVSWARDDVRVSIIRDGDEILAYFPHHLPKDGIARPIGAPMSDYQGVIAGDYSRLSLDLVAKAAGCSALVYDNWYCPMGGHPGGLRERDGSVIADLGDGADSYFAQRKAAFKDHFKKSARRQRAAERDFGPVRVELGDASGEAFAALVHWKRRQYTETGKLDVMGIPWVRSVLDNLRRREGQEFSGLTASLWFGDRLAAVEFGLVGADIYHSWFPAYDPELAKYSPGLLLLHGLFEQAQDRGLQRIDLGRGGTHYKKYYASYEVGLDSGRFLRPGLAALGIRGWEYAETAASVLPGKVAQIPCRARRRWAQISAFETQFSARINSFVSAFSL